MLIKSLNKVVTVVGDWNFGMSMLVKSHKLFYGGFMQAFKELLSVTRLTHDPNTVCQTGLKLFRLILNEAHMLLQLCFSNNMHKVVNENNLTGLLDIRKLNVKEKIIIKCEYDNFILDFIKKHKEQIGKCTKCDDEIFGLLSNF